MKRVVIGLLILAHGLAHANVIVWASASTAYWFVNTLDSVVSRRVY